MAYCRLEDTFVDHAKFRKLARRLGVSAVTARGHVAMLWSWALRYAPDGGLGDRDPEDIELAVEWEGESGAFVSACVDVGVIDRVDDGLEIHQYYDRNESLKSAQRMRESRERKRAERLQGVTQPCATVPKSSAEQSGAEQSRAKQNGAEQNTTSPAKADARSVDIQIVWGKYREHHPKAPGALKSSRKEYKLVKARLEDGYSVADLCQAIDGYHRSPFHLGDNDRGQTYLGLGLIMRDPDHVTKGIEMANDPNLGTILSEKTRRTVSAAKSWAEKQRERDAANGL